MRREILWLLFGVLLVLWIFDILDRAHGQSIPVWTNYQNFQSGPMGAYLAQSRCPDLSTPNNCANPYQMNDTMGLTWRKRDWPGPYDGVISDSVWTASGAVASTFSTAPFGPWIPPNDGGDVYTLNTGASPATALGVKTRDGGVNRDIYFVGAGCGGTGWVMFDAKTPIMPSYWGPSEQWRRVTAEIGQASSPSSCAPLSGAVTQFRLELLQVPFLMYGTPVTLPVPTIISEHYNNAPYEQSTTLERFYFGLGWGKYRWELWSQNSPSRGDISGACPGISPWEYSPGGLGVTLQLSDCRMWTNIIAANGSFALNQYGWGWP